MLYVSDFYVDDGSIQKITSSLGKLEVIFLDWQEVMWTISFFDLIAFESLGAENETLGSFHIENSNDYKERVIKLLPDEAKISSKIYIFSSAWSNLPVLQVIAGKVSFSKLK